MPDQKNLIVAAFDFDVTMTTKDTFFPFLVAAFGRVKVYLAFASLGLQGLLVLLRLSSRDKFKEKVIYKLFCNAPVDDLTRIGEIYAEHIITLIRPKALERLEWHRKNNHRLVMVSASLDLYLEPVVAALNFDNLLCTRLNKKDGKFTGYLNGENCRGQGKVNYLKELLGDLNQVELYAYGDSQGDKEMLEIATHSFFRPFEKKGMLSGGNK